jgi:hypothetical protein
VASRACCGSFLFEATKTIRVNAKGGRQHLDRDISTEPRIASTVDFAHAAGADQRHDFVWAKTNAGP